MENILELEKVKMCKLEVSVYQNLWDDYNESSLKEAYESVYKESFDSFPQLKEDTKINHLIAYRYVYLFPESGEGFKKDLEILESIMELL